MRVPFGILLLTLASVVGCVNASGKRFLGKRKDGTTIGADPKYTYTVTHEAVNAEEASYWSRLMQETTMSVAPMPKPPSPTPGPSRPEPPSPTPRPPAPTSENCDDVEYTVSLDFDKGDSINVNSIDVADQLQLNSVATPFKWIWVAASARGTIIKVDTETGEILGEYLTTPGVNSGSGNPSRTTVDNDGSVWVANRNGNPGSVVHVGLLENGQCEDRNGNGVIDTSTGLGDIKPWGDLSGTRKVATADDECIVSYTEVSSSGTRHVSVTPENDVWVSGKVGRNWDLVKGGNVNVVSDSGVTIIIHYNGVRVGGYGGLIDKNDVIWSTSAGSLLRWDTNKPLEGPNGDPAGPDIGPPINNRNWSGQNAVGHEYGLCVDPAGNVWNTNSYGGTIVKYAPDGKYIGTYSHGGNKAQGCVADTNGDIWVAHSLSNAITVGHLKNDGTLAGVVDLLGGNGPTGVAVDKNGKVWAANYNSNTLSRIDPTLNGGIGKVDMTVDLGAGAGPYNYSDMTGSTLIAPPSSGTWTVIYNSEEADKVWNGLVWNELTPGDSTLTVKAASSNDGVTFGVLQDPNDPIPNGQYLKVVVSFSRGTNGDSPILYDLSIKC
jgi:streptogramin lyase